MTKIPEAISRTARAVAAFVRWCPDIDAAERQVADALMEERERCAMALEVEAAALVKDMSGASPDVLAQFQFAVGVLLTVAANEIRGGAKP